MNKKLIAAIVLFILSITCPALSFQESVQPLTKQEIVSLLKQAESKQISQGDIAGEIDRRGISFVADERTLNEFQKLGARAFLLEALKRAPKEPPQMATPAQNLPAETSSDLNDEEARQRARAAALSRLPLIEQARHHSLEYANELPDFITTQVVTRYVQTPDSKDWRLEDTLEIELTYSSEKGEQFKVLRVNGKPYSKSYEEMGGTTSTGEFGTLLTSLFLPQTRTVFREAKKELFNGKQSVVYDFSVKKANSLSTLTDKPSGKRTVAGFSGSLWVDSATAKVLRIEIAHEGMPADFPITLAENAIEYDWVKIEGESYLLPVRAEVILGSDRNRVYTRNRIEFRNYKKFEAKIKIQ